MLGWFSSKKEKKKPPEVLLNTFDAIAEKLLKKTDNDFYGFNNRKHKCTIPLALNYFLYYVSQRGFQDNINYRVNVKALLDFIDFCFFNSKPADQSFTRISCGANKGKYTYYFTLIDNGENELLTTGTLFVHTGYKKAIHNLVELCKRPAKEKEYIKATIDALREDQAKMQKWYEKRGLLGNEEEAKAADEDASDVTFTESFSGEDSEDTAIPAPKSVRKQIMEISTPAPKPYEQTEQEKLALEWAIENPYSMNNPYISVTPIQKNNDNAQNITAEPVVNIDQSIIDPELKEALNVNETLNSLLEPQPKETVVDLIPPKILIESEQEVLKEVVKEVVKKHHDKRVRDESFDGLDYMDSSTQRKMLREEARYESRKRTGRLINGPNTLAAQRIATDYRMMSRDAAGREINPNRSYTKQDDDYLDYAFYGFIREYGTIMNDIMKLPLGFDYNSYRRGSNVTVKALHFRNTFTHVTGTKASGRMILFYSEKEWTYTLFGRHWTSVKVEEILQKSVTMYAGDLEELEAADVFYNPTIMSQYDFKNVILGRQFQILYDYYVDLNTQAVKGLVGEDIESVDSIKTKWVKIDGLELPFFYDGDDDKPTRGCLGVLFMGDYFGGEIETNMTLRVFYNSN